MAFSSAQARVTDKGANAVDPDAQPGAQQAPAAGSTTDLQKAIQDPVASLISVPVQKNSNFAIG